MMQVNTLDALRQQRATLPGTVALVPTMGNLHAGHLELVRVARQLAEHVVVSIFVNPMQFAGGEDIDAYPRTLIEDKAKLEHEGVSLLFTPPVEALYPGDMASHTRIEVPGVSDLYCGASRPGHFVGVATVVCKLFNMVQPDTAVFGQKDYQQLMVIKHMVDDLAIPVAIHGVPTVRESDGLAMSSRNGYLTEEQRGRAPLLYAVLQETAARLSEGTTQYQQLEKQARSRIEQAGLKLDYFSIVDADNLGAPCAGKDLVILLAAYLGKARLIDNLEVSAN
jgi:pantoate--beta-alanine ligase